MKLATRRFSRLVRDDDVDQRLRSSGVAVVGPVLNADELSALSDLFGELTRHISPIDGPWFTTGMIPDPVLRRWVFDKVGDIVRPRVEPLLSEDCAVLAGNFHVNPIHESGGLGPHQDIALVDETVSSTLNGWISLSDATVDNGALRFVLGSHRFGNRDRSLAAPWAYHGLHDVFWEHAKTFLVPAGHLILFDTAVVHCSTPNRTDRPRVAVNCLLRPRSQPLQHLVATDDDHVDVFGIDEAFLIEGDVSGSPSDRHGRFVTRRLMHHPVSDVRSIDQLCRAALDEVGN